MLPLAAATSQDLYRCFYYQRPKSTEDHKRSSVVVPPESLTRSLSEPEPPEASFQLLAPRLLLRRQRCWGRWSWFL